jgi:hypothetical protein
LDAKALDKLNEKVRGSLDVSIDLAEAHKTAKMLKVTDTVTDLVKTAVSRKLGVLKALGNAWLLNTYGIQPLMQTVYGLAEENLRTVINRTEHLRVRASGKFLPTICNVPAVVGSVDFPVLNPGSELKTSVTYGLDLRTDQFDLARFSSLNPLSIAWELTPYSFVADWFYDIGGYLRNLETACLYANKFRSGYRTTLVAGHVRFGLFQTGGGAEPYSSKWDGDLQMIDINRRLLTSYPAPRLPSLRAQLGSSRLLSAAALMAQHLKRAAPTPRASGSLLRGVQKQARRYNSKPGDRYGALPPSDWGV